MSCNLLRKQNTKKYLVLLPLFSFFAIFFNLALFSNNTYAAASGQCLRVIFTVTNNSATGGGATTEKSSDWLCAKTDDKGNTTTRLGIYEFKQGDRVTTKHASAYKSGTALVITAKDKSNKIQFHGGAGTSMKDFTVKTNGVTFDSIVSGVKDGFGKTSPVTDSTLNSYKYKGVETDTLENVKKAIADAESDESSEASGEDADPCYSGAGTLGHMICPLIKAFGELADTAYVDLIQPALILEPELLSDSSGTFTGWQYFQNFANIAFIIMLLIVVLSQVTGIGLSNYGIKKTLPKLVVAVVLINISYIICQLAVDLSNVLGVGLKSLMDGLTETLHEEMELNEVVFNADATTNVDKWDFGSTIASLALLGGIVAGAGTLLSQGFAVLMPLILVAVAVVIGIMLFFVLLSVRKAGVVLLVVLSPLAFVCYMLPNTKKLFDKWYKAFVGLLLLFPICGLIIGGGDFASTILLSVNEDSGKCDFFFALTAMVIGVLPIFFIPLILKNSMAAMGNIGARLSNRGRALSSGLQGRISNSDAYKLRSAKLAAGRPGGLREKVAQSRVGKLTGAHGGLARSRMRYDKLLAEQGSLEAAYGEDFLLETQTANEMKRIVSSGEINNSVEMKKKLSKALQQGDRAKIRAYTDALSGQGDSGRKEVKAAWEDAVGHGVSAEAAQTFGDNILAKHALDYKSNARSMYKAASDAAIRDKDGNAAPNIHTANTSDVAELLSNARPSTIANMDDDEFLYQFGYNAETGELEDASKLNSLSGDDLEAVKRNVYKAIQGATGEQLKSGRYKAMSKIVEGYKPQGDGPDVLQVHEVGSK